MEILIMGAIFAIMSLGLIAVLIVEFREYQRYSKAAHSVIAFGESMQVSFGEVAEHLNRINNMAIEIGQGLNSTEQEVNFIKGVLQVHSEALNLNLGKLEAMKYGEDIIRKIQG